MTQHRDDERHRKIRAALRSLHEIFNEEAGTELGVVLLVSPQAGPLVADYGSSITDRRRVLAILRERVRLFEEQLGEAA